MSTDYEISTLPEKEVKSLRDATEKDVQAFFRKYESALGMMELSSLHGLLEDIRAIQVAKKDGKVVAVKFYMDGKKPNEIVSTVRPSGHTAFPRPAKKGGRGSRVQKQTRRTKGKRRNTVRR